MHPDNQDSAKDKTQSATALSRNMRLAVPVGAILMLLLLGLTISHPGDVTSLFVPVYIVMLIVYVFTSIYMFKTVMDKETPSH